jgi:hypothetical protein
MNDKPNRCEHGVSFEHFCAVCIENDFKILRARIAELETECERLRRAVLRGSVGAP